MSTAHKKTTFKGVLKINAVIFLLSIGSMYMIVLATQGDMSARATAILAFAVLGFFAFTFYYYYMFITGQRKGNPSPFPDKIFLLNLLASLSFILLIMWLLIER